VFTNAIASTVTGDVSAQSIQFNAPQGLTVTGSVDGGTGTLIGASTSLTVGNGGTTGTLSGNVTNNGVLAFDRSDTVNFVDALAGSGQLVQIGSGTLLFDGDGSAFAGSTQVQAGTLVVGGAAGSTAVLAGNVDVAAGATLGGHGSIDGNVSMANGSVLSPGHSIGTLSVDGDLLMAQGSSMDVELGAAGAGDKVAVNGNLALNGVTLDVSDVGGMGPGVYTIFSYTGALTETNGGLLFGATPAGHTLQLVTLLGSKQINILDVSNTTLNFWNANGLASGAQMGGGDGTWSTASPNWTDAVGSISGVMSPQPGLAVFGGAPGTVTVDGTDGQVAAVGLQFLTDGYHMTGDSMVLTWSSGTPVIRVGDGSESTAGYVATIDNVLMGTQGLAKNDAGTLVLNGANTYTGETTVNGGTLSVGDDRNLGAAANGVTLNGGTLRVTGSAYSAATRAMTLDSGGAVDIADAANAFAWDGAIAGNGSLEKRGAGTLVLDHANTYTGGTLVTQGTLRLGDSRAIGSGALALADGTTLDLAADGLALSNAVSVAGASTVNVNASGAATLSGVLADGTSAGSLSKIGAGELRLTGNNTYTGTTTIAAGALRIGDGGTTGSVTGDIVNHGALILDRSDDVTYAGVLSGDGSFRKLGVSALRLTGDSGAFTGTTEVTAGTLQLDGKLGGDLSMASGTVLSGVGTGGSVLLQSGAEVSPGGQGATATLAFTGDLTMAAGTRYTVDVTDAGQGDRLDVAGHASLEGGSVVSLGTGGNWNTATTYTILSAANGVTGTFGDVFTDLAFLTPSLAYTANAVNLTLARNAVAFPDVALTHNERATAGAVEALGAGAAAYDAILRLDAADARAAFDSLSGEIHASVRTAIADDQRYQREAINNHLLNADAAGRSEGVSGWAAGWGHWGKYDGDGNAARMDTNGSGLLVGADTVVGQSTRVGIALGIGQISASTPARDASADVRTHTAGLYAGGREGAFQWQAGALYGQQNIRTHRDVSVADVAARVGSDDDAHAAQGYVEGAYVFDGSRGSWAPFVNAAYQQLRTPTIHEDGSFGALEIDSDRSSQTFGTVGLRGEMKLRDAGTALFGSVGWRHAWGDVDSASRMRFAGGGAAFGILGVPIAEDAVAISAGLRFRPSTAVTIDATYSGQFASDVKDQAARLSLNWAF
jgi:autotransporter-associated beta strand protein